MLTYIIATLILSALQIKSQRGIREEIIARKTRLDGEVCQSININGIEQIRVLSAEDAETRRLAPQIHCIKQTEQHHHLWMGCFDAVKHLVKVTFFAVILIVGTTLLAEGELSGGEMLTVVLLFQQLLKPLDEWYRCMDESSACSVKSAMLSEILDLPVDPAFDIPDKDFEFTGYDVEIDEYEVCAPNGEKVLSKSHDLCFHAGGSTALVAQNGGGKSSLWKGITRLYPLNGTLRLFGVEWDIISQKTLTSLVHFIPQFPNFFLGSVRDNIAYGLETLPNDKELLDVLEKTCVLDDLKAIGKMPLDVVIQEGGKNFSGGQLKRLALARALLRKPKLYVLDETMANIDAVSIPKILGNLESYAKSIDATIIHIAHDKDVISRCDSIVTFN